MVSLEYSLHRLLICFRSKMEDSEAEEGVSFVFRSLRLQDEPCCRGQSSFPICYLHFANTETMTSSFLGKAAAFLQSTQQPHSENKSHLKWPPISFNLPLMKSGTFPSDVAPQHGRDLRAKPETRGLRPLWRCGTCGLGRGYGSRYERSPFGM